MKAHCQKPMTNAPLVATTPTRASQSGEPRGDAGVMVSGA
jgi:hypothetical protein